MKTMLLAPELFATGGGIPRILRLYLKALCDSAGPNDRVGFVVLNDPVVDDNELRTYGNSKLGFWTACSRSKKRFVKAAMKHSAICDRIVCGHIGQLPVCLIAKIRRPWIKYYLVAHGIEVWGKISLPKRIALHFAEKVICVSDHTRQGLLQRVRLNPEKCVVLHNALDPLFEVDPGLPLDSGAPAILTVTRLTYADNYKGVDHLIEAMPAILSQEPSTTLRIVGRGDDLPRLQRLATKLGLLNSSVTFLGYINDEAMTQEMASCRLFSLPSRDEGFGLVYLEAMARGRPCLAVLDGAASEVITEQTGVFVNFGDVPSIVTATVKALRTRWDQNEILDRAKTFSFEVFRAGLASILGG